MFGALKHGRFRSLGSLILVVNVVGELQRKRTLAASRGFLAAARLSCYLCHGPMLCVSCFCSIFGQTSRFGTLRSIPRVLQLYSWSGIKSTCALYTSPHYIKTLWYLTKYNLLCKWIVKLQILTAVWFLYFQHCHIIDAEFCYVAAEL